MILRFCQWWSHRAERKTAVKKMTHKLKDQRAASLQATRTIRKKGLSMVLREQNVMEDLQFPGDGT